MLTIEDAERIRKKRNLSPEHFSLKLGFSPNAYRRARDRKRISRFMAKEISQRFGVKLDGGK